MLSGMQGGAGRVERSAGPDEAANGPGPACRTPQSCQMLRLNALLFQPDNQSQETDPELWRRSLREAVTLAGGRCLPDLDVPAETIARLCAEALKSGIEPDRVQHLITQYGVLPAGPHALAWPWPLRIYTLGRFSIVKNGEPVGFTGRKSPRRLLELLQALIALGGRDVNTAALMQAVWPEEHSADMRKLFDNTLHRLRKVLGFEDALVLRDAKLSLDSRVCWVDAWAFDRLAKRHIEGTAPEGKDARAVLALYQGHFLEREEDQRWLMVYRDRLRSRFHRLVLAQGARLEAAGRWAGAIEVYERALEMDNLAESLYQRLIYCQLKRGERAEALRAYRRCRELLSIVLGVAPSPETESLRRGIEQGVPAERADP